MVMSDWRFSQELPFSELPCVLTNQVFQILPPSPSSFPSSRTYDQLRWRAKVLALRASVRKGLGMPHSYNTHRALFSPSSLALPFPSFARASQATVPRGQGMWMTGWCFSQELPFFRTSMSANNSSFSVPPAFPSSLHLQSAPGK